MGKDPLDLRKDPEGTLKLLRGHSEVSFIWKEAEAVKIPRGLSL
jgi:hypothetical protein